MQRSYKQSGSNSHRKYKKINFFPPSLSSVVFWFGDLNFRIEDYDIHVVKCAIDSNKLPLLWERDQVRPLFFTLSLNPTMHDQQRVLLWTAN